MLSIDKNQMILEHFRCVTFISSTKIDIVMEDMTISIMGNALQVLALGKEEILIEGVFQALRFDHEL